MTRPSPLVEYEHAAEQRAECRAARGDWGCGGCRAAYRRAIVRLILAGAAWGVVALVAIAIIGGIVALLTIGLAPEPVTDYQLPTL